MRVDGLGGNRWALAFGFVGVFANDVAHPEACEGCAVGVEQELWGGLQGRESSGVIQLLSFNSRFLTPDLLL